MFALKLNRVINTLFYFILFYILYNTISGEHKEARYIEGHSKWGDDCRNFVREIIRNKKGIC